MQKWKKETKKSISAGINWTIFVCVIVCIPESECSVWESADGGFGLHLSLIRVNMCIALTGTYVQEHSKTKIFVYAANIYQ